MKSYPEIRFKYPWLLLKALDPVLKPAYADMGKEYVLDEKFITGRIGQFEELWRPHEEKIVQGMCTVFGLEFRQNVIDIYVAPFRNSFSDPMVVSTKTADERLVDVIAHELLHRLLSDNTFSEQGDNKRRWQRLFGDHPKIVLNHIAVHAGLQALWCDVLGEPERVRRDKDACRGREGYRQAWEYVEEYGYQTIVSQVKVSYTPNNNS